MRDRSLGGHALADTSEVCVEEEIMRRLDRYEQRRLLEFEFGFLPNQLDQFGE